MRMDVLPATGWILISDNVLGNVSKRHAHTYIARNIHKLKYKSNILCIIQTFDVFAPDDGTKK